LAAFGRSVARVVVIVVGLLMILDIVAKMPEEIEVTKTSSMKRKAK
jgi:hypothetical protein